MCNQNGDRQEIHREMEKLHLATEDAIASAALGGKIWNSLGSKELIKQQIKSMVDKLDRQRPEHLKYNAKFIRFKEELKNVEDDLASLEDQQTELRRLIYEARVCISEWRAKQEEKNDSYNQYIELMRNAQELAKRKDLASLEDLCHQQVEKFRSQWVRDKAFRDDYITRRIPSLNSQCLNIDGRRRNPNEKPIIIKDPDANISKAIKKALEQYQRETSAYLGDSECHSW
ncbi:hypothetical protein SAY87_011671 [Trapa incisa]|uniref:Uncharacterized protein n=1 Tax=Trapa incisa TaxID=236973 RepID=A0AAN7JIG5_9MYRT|nr:hypothetical protein SAY87_011671 [Trapa incisa]